MLSSSDWALLVTFKKELVVTLLAQVSIYRAHMNDEDKDYHDAIVWWLEEHPEGKAWREE